VQIDALVTAFTSASSQMETMSVAELSSADQHTVANNVATMINGVATQLNRFPQSTVVISLLAQLDVQIQLFLNVLAVVVIGILDIIANM
jgi:hypothetical protein